MSIYTDIVYSSLSQFGASSTEVETHFPNKHAKELHTLTEHFERHCSKTFGEHIRLDKIDVVELPFLVSEPKDYFARLGGYYQKCNFYH